MPANSAHAGKSVTGSQEQGKALPNIFFLNILHEHNEAASSSSKIDDEVTMANDEDVKEPISEDEEIEGMDEEVPTDINTEEDEGEDMVNEGGQASGMEY